MGTDFSDNPEMNNLLPTFNNHYFSMTTIFDADNGEWECICDTPRPVADVRAQFWDRVRFHLTLFRASSAEESDLGLK